MGSEQSKSQEKKIDLKNVDQNFKTSKFSNMGSTSIKDDRFGKIEIIELDYGQTIFKKRLEFNNTKLFNSVKKFKIKEIKRVSETKKRE